MSETPKLHVYRLYGYLVARHYLHGERVQAASEEEAVENWHGALARFFCPANVEQWEEMEAHVTARREDA